MSIKATSPDISATVTASAGSGKTWLLVSRLLRLLLHGAEPGTILALTFTRKAAGEMKARLTERLQEMALANDEKLEVMLNELDEKPTVDMKKRARLLYEQLIFSDYPIKTLTFHSFCQDILSRFPVEANIPPAFELVENTGLLVQQSIQQLYNEATLKPDGELASHLETLLQHCKSIDSTRTALTSFLDHRSDWWAYSEGQAEPVQFAIEKLTKLLKVEPDNSPYALLFSRDLPEKLERFRELHMQIATDKQMVHAETIAVVLGMQSEPEQAFYEILPAFLTQKMEPQKRKETGKSQKILGVASAEYIQLHDEISERLLEINEFIAREKTMQRNIAWYHAGTRLLTLYQRLKSQLRSLDFTDLEWLTYQLLKQSDNAHWVQYKLDQRIDHFLIDEFQDTNPTQWHLLQPLLEELAAGESERRRSIFIVGDEKQSIYGFRRANPELQAYVSGWLSKQINAQAFPLNKSWRSSPAIINSVNHIFLQDTPLLADFPEHGTHKEEMPGYVECCPMFAAPDKADEPEPVYFRNPLKEPRFYNKNIQYENEARWIADKIYSLVERGLIIDKDGKEKPIDYNDINILVRNRTHVKTIETALRQKQIPFTSANRGTLLESLEIQDLEMLLESLISPFNDVAIAQILKSPLFSASDDDLLQLSKVSSAKRWFKKLEAISEELDESHPLHRAHTMLSRWRKLADHIPVHDLLDKIYFESNLVNRYLAASPDAIRAQVKANLISFLELALDIDSGRYPSITRFLFQLKNYRRIPGSDAPDEAPSNSGQARVNIMTIHASKGLEAPVIFLADSATRSAPKLAHRAMVHWPATSAKPEAFHLMGTKDQLDSITQKYVEIAAGFQQREDMNLLYVALTRARQCLFVSASEPAKNNNPMQPSWYQLIHDGLTPHCETDTDENLVYQYGELRFDPVKEAIEQPREETVVVPEGLSKPLFEKEEAESIAPSQQLAQAEAHSVVDEDSMIRGTVIHRMLELLTTDNVSSPEQIIFQVKTEVAEVMSDEQYEQCFDEASQLIKQPELAYLFNTEHFQRAYNELPIHYHQQNRRVHGVIDRVVMCDNTIYLVDYKTSQNESDEILKQRYAEQLNFYKKGLMEIWPDFTINPMLLLTHSGRVIEC